MANLTQQLTDIANLLHIAGAPAFAQPGQQVTTTLAPALGPIAFTDIVDQPVNLELILKQVVFTDTGFAAPGTTVATPAWIEDPDISKILPMFNLAAGAIPTLDNSGVPGLIGRCKGNFPVAVPGEAIPTLTVEWTVTDDAGNTLSDGSDYLAPNGRAAPTLNVVFLPAFADAPALVGRKLTAKVTLSAGGASVSRDVGPVRIEIPALLFPRVLALTLNAEFNGAALVLVPGGSPVNSVDHLRALLQPVRSAISTLTSIARFAEMLTGIDTLTGILEASNIEFRKGDRFDNLNDIDLITRAWYENDTEAEDELSAFAYLSPSSPRGGNAVEMCNARDLKNGEGRFTVVTGNSFVALCRTLHSAAPVAAPGTLTVTKAPPGGWFNPSTFGDELSSIRFL